MAYSNIELVFGRRVELGETITFAWRDLDVPASDILTDEECVTIRQGFGQFEYEDAANSWYSLQSYKDSFEIDFNAANKFDVSSVGGSLNITAKKDNIEFYGFVSNAGVTATITNQTPIATFNIDSIGFSDAGANQCSDISVDVVTTSPILNVTSPLVANAVNNVNYSFVWVRGATFQFEAIDSDGSTVSQSVNTPEFLLEPTIDIINTPSGATANISQQLSLTGLMYSLDNVTYQNSAVFSGLLAGNFIAYVKDIYGCTKSTAFVVDAFSPVVGVEDPVHFISNTNSFRFKLDEVWDNITIYKNDNNTLSNEEKGTLIYPYIHKYQNTDKVTTQLKTNYDNITGAIIDCDGNETALTFIQKTNNLDKKDRRDAIAYEFADGRYGYYFISGNIYDYDDGAINTITGTYELYGQVPVWGRIGNYFSLNDGAYYQVVDIVYVESIQARVLVINTSLAGNPVNVKLSAIYNIFNWNAYEFDVDFGAFLNTGVQIRINFDDTDFDSKVYYSEKIQTYDILDDLIAIEATNTFNNEIVYQDGMKHLLRLQYDEFGSSNESELEVEKTDQYVYSIDGKTYIKKKLTFNYLSTKMEQKVRQILTLDDIKIDGVGHTVESIDAPERLGVTNLYKLTCSVYEVGAKPQGTVVDTNVELDILDVPALILGDDEYVKQ